MALIKKFDANFTSVVGILSVPDAFLELRDFRIKFTSLEVTCFVEAKVLLERELNWLFTDIFFIFFMLDWFSYFLIMLCKAILQSKSFWFQATGPFYNVNITLIKKSACHQLYLIVNSKHDVTIIETTLVGKKRFHYLPKFSVCHYTLTCNIRKILFYWFFPDWNTFITLAFV